jgi:anti-sigma-K factor RskA
MSNNAHSPCDRAETLRDYAYEELNADDRRAMEQHLAACGDCALELDRLRITTAALRTLPDREIPQRIAFVSDRVFAPSAVSRWFGGFWNSAARLGFASACVLAAALVVSAYHRPAAEVRTIVQTADISKQVNEAVTKEIARVRMEDAKMTQAALAIADRKHEQEHRALMVAMGENLTILQKRLNTWTIASNMPVGSEAGQ